MYLVGKIERVVLTSRSLFKEVRNIHNKGNKNNMEVNILIINLIVDIFFF